MNTYTNLTMNQGFQFPVQIKEKVSELMRRVIEGSPRMSEDFVFEGYGVITYKDEAQLHAEVEMLEKFSKKNTNCMVFRMPATSRNRNRYTHMFLYWTYNVGKNDMSSYLLYNENTGRCVHIANIEGDLNDIMSSMNRTINECNTADKLEKYTRDHPEYDNQYHKRNKWMWNGGKEETEEAA